MFELKSKEFMKKNINFFILLDKEFVYKENADYYVQEISGKIQAYAEIIKKNENKKYIITKIYVEEAQRYKNIGTKLIKFIKKNLTERGCKILATEIFCENKFFEKLGFKYENNELVYNKIANSKKRYYANKKVILFSIIGNIILATSKIWAGIAGKSRALLSDGINSFSDIGTSTGMLIGNYYSNIPEDEEHPYGHEKIETIIANIMGIIMILTAFELGRGSIELLYSYTMKKEISAIPILNAAYWGIFSAIVKFFMYFYKIKIGKETKNYALIADAKDSRNDVFTSIGAVIGIILSVYVNPIFDIIMSIPISLIILREGIGIIFENAEIILEKQNTELLLRVEKYIYENSIIKNVHEMKMRNSGHKIFLTFHIRVPGNMQVSKAHEIADFLEDSISVEFEEITEVLIHIDPIIEHEDNSVI